jgi:hypothetical protein
VAAAVKGAQSLVELDRVAAHEVGDAAYAEPGQVAFHRRADVGQCGQVGHRPI